jgi:hypothetical protein
MIAKTVVNAFPCTAGLRVPVKEHSKFFGDLVVREPGPAQSVHLVWKEPCPTTTGCK